jgi:hypothetical protein
MPDSVNEYYVAMALDKEEIKYMFQYQVIGTGRELGSITVDFLVFAPFAIPLEVMGEHWHSGSLGSGDRYRLDIISQQLKMEPKILWGNETDSYDKARKAVRKMFL